MSARSTRFAWILLTLLAHLSAQAQVRVNGVPIAISPPHQYLPSGSLILQLLGTSRVELLMEPRSAVPSPVSSIQERR